MGHRSRFSRRGAAWAFPLLVILWSLAFVGPQASAAFNPGAFSHHEEVALRRGQPVQQGFSVGVVVDTEALISAGLMRTDGGDLVLAWDSTGTGGWVEIDAHVRPLPNEALETSTATQVWFALQEPQGVGIFPYAGRYRIYSGNPTETLASRMRDGRAVYRFFDDFSGSSYDSSVWYVHPNYQQGVSVAGGILHINGRLYPQNPANRWQGKSTRMLTQSATGAPTFQVDYLHPFAMETRFRSYDLSDDVRPVNYLMHVPLDQSDLDEYTLFIAESSAKGGGVPASDNFRLGKVLNATGDPVANSDLVITSLQWYDAKVTVWPTSLAPGQEDALMAIFLDDSVLDDSLDAPTNPYDASRTQGVVGLQSDLGTEMDVDWTAVRDHVPNEPFAAIDPAVNITIVDGVSGTGVSWTTTAAGASFDVLRGNLEELVEIGGEVLLQNAVCIEDDSTDQTTAPGSLDTAVPSPGAAFFYLVRAATPGGGIGTFGASSAGFERRAEPGTGCSAAASPP